MPLYDYMCLECLKEFEVVKRISECDSSETCSSCGGNTKKIIKGGRGGIWRKSDSLPWLRSASELMCGGTGEKVETVDQYRDFLSRHPHVRPKEDHPCLPSSMGDYLYEKPDQKQIKRERSKKGHELIRDMRKITIHNVDKPKQAPQNKGV